MDIHQGSKGTYEVIGTYDPSELCFSKQNRWDRMGLLGILADYFLNYSKGAVLEIGAGESSVYLNSLSIKYNRKAFFCDIQGSIYRNALTVPGYFNEDRILLTEEDVPVKHHNEQCLLYIGASDSFFKYIQLPPLAVAFIDGGHMYEQVKKDFWNVIPLIEETGAVFLHDTFPPSEDYLHENACGTGYKLRQELEADPNLEVFTFIRSAMSVGMTMVRKKRVDAPYYQR